MYYNILRLCHVSDIRLFMLGFPSDFNPKIIGGNWISHVKLLLHGSIWHNNLMVVVHFQQVHSKSQALTFNFPIDLPTHTGGMSLMWPHGKCFPVTSPYNSESFQSKVGSDN